ncbi:MAG: hypothetical protein R3F62_21695 [Planctomycetota bacterium]
MEKGAGSVAEEPNRTPGRQVRAPWTMSVFDHSPTWNRTGQLVARPPGA